MMDLTIIDVSVLTAIIGVLVFGVNVITEVIKKVLPEKFPTQLFVMILSIVLAIVCFADYAEIKSIDVAWYMVVATVFVGFMVAYAAMFGFDTLKGMLEKLKG